MCRRFEALGIVLVVAAVLAGQGWIATAGTWSLAIDDLPFLYTTEVYARQAEAFAAGQAHLRIAPPAELARLPDPYDPAARAPFGAESDLSYFNGKYWLYFGPVPALAILVPQLIAGRPIADSVITLAGAMTATVAGALAIRGLARALLSRGGTLAACAAVVALGLNAPLLFLLASPAIHEAATAAGQGFLLAGLSAAVWAWQQPAGRGQGLLWLLAGGSWALAVGSRWALAPAVAGLALLFVLLAWHQRARRRWMPVLLLGAPLAAGALLLGGYNAARFGSPLEVGHRYQLTSYHLLRDYAGFATLGHLAPNLVHFFLRPLRLTPELPFISWTPYESWNATFCAGAPDGLIFGPIVGLLPAAPFSILALAGVVLPRRRTARRAAIVWAGLLAAAALAALPVLAQRWVTLRYAADFAPLLMVAAFAALVGAIDAFPRWRGAIIGLALLLAAATAVVGLLFGMQGAFGHFERHNAPLWEALEARFPPLTATVGPADAVEPTLRVRFGERIEVVGARFAPDTADPGEEVSLRLWLRAPEGATIRLRLRERSGGIAFDEQVAIPPLADLAEARLRFRLPADPWRARPPDYLAAELALAEARAPSQLLPARDPAGGSPGEWVSVEPLRLRWPFPWPPTGATRHDLSFGEQLHLEGSCVAKVGLTEDSPAALRILLYWTALARGPDRTLVLELMDSAGQSVARVAGEPGDGLFRTSLWRTGERIEDDWELALPPLPPGDYRLRLRVEGLPARGDPTIATVRIP
ncbi:MAG: hypothetical protein RMM58_01585 [Chloroflexota bacterium]|nr:hypothetical protein [Dehalococcoidia bacterium]MDW8252551.1 hypothetical protein [Chloroflexota bacterium]